MTYPRVLFVTDRTWPAVDQSTLAIESMAASLVGLGCRATLLTAGGSRTWPDRFRLSNCDVMRIQLPARGILGALRRARNRPPEMDALARAADIVIACGTDELATMAGELASQHGRPLVWWPISAIETNAQTTTRQRWATLLNRLGTGAVFIESESQRSSLLSSGIGDESIFELLAAVDCPADGAANQRLAARMNIGSLQPSLSVKADTALAAYIGPLDAEQQLNSLVVAWSYVVTRRPSARLWFVGDGPGAEELSEQIRRHECHRDMLITGWFDNLDDVYAAVDLVIVPQPTPHPCRFVLGALARGRPVLYRHKQRNWMSERKWGVACPGRNSLEFAQAIGNALERSTTGQPTDEVPVASIRDRHELQSQARKFRDICCQLIARKVHVETR